MDNNSLLYQIALTLVPNIGPVQARQLLQQLEVVEIFKTSRSTLEKIEGIGEVRARSIKAFGNFREAEKEIAFIEKYKIKTLFITEKDYPQRLLNASDPPTLLYYRGRARLNCSRVVSVIGTRGHTEYGKKVTEKLIQELAPLDVLIISGMAYGIDAIAHRAALSNGIPTAGVLAHGLGQIYPPQHASLAREMMKEGGLLTEFRSSSKPDKHNFPIRNRIVAGMSDATIVIETGIKGGSMITAELANGYHKDVFAVPGRVTDHKSAGCNDLIRTNKAVLLTDAQQLMELMGWEDLKKKEPVKQPGLFVELTDNEKILVEILKQKEAVQIDELNLRSGLSNSAVAAAILNLELQNIISSGAGRVYRLI